MDNSKEFQVMLNKAIISEPFTFVDFDRTKNVQDQLQEMVLSDFVQQEGGYLPTYWLFHKFQSWLPDCRYVATSMEQLWLAFVMKQKYNKTWNSEEWTDAR